MKSHRNEYVSPEGLRLDGRRPTECRHIKCRMGIWDSPDGSAMFQQGNTIALAAVYGPRELTKGRAIHDTAIINCEYSMATFSTRERRRRAKDRRATEISLVLQQTFEAVIFRSLFPKSVINIYVNIIQADGGTRCAAINAATLALVDAGIPMRDLCCACAAGCIDGIPILDLNFMEDSAGGPDLPVALLPKSDKIVLLQMDSKVSRELFTQVLDLATKGCHIIYDIMANYVRQHGANLIESRETQADFTTKSKTATY